MKVIYSRLIPIISVLFIQLLIISACTERIDKVSDSYYIQTIVGAWEVQYKGDGFEIDAIDEYSSDGKIYQKGVIKTLNGVVDIEMSSDWAIKDGILTSTIKSINVARPALIGNVTKDTIISMDESVFKFRNEKGRVISITRRKR